MNEQQTKSLRLLSLYERLSRGKILTKKEEALHFGVNEKTIQRDLDELRLYLSTISGESITLEYSYQKKGYVLQRQEDVWLTKEEILALAKILLETRAFSVKEMNSLLEKLIIQSQPSDRTFIQDVIRNERFHYVPLGHEKSLLSMMWDLGDAIRSQKLVSIYYEKELEKKAVERIVKPVGMLFSDYYFYLAAYLVDYDFEFPTIYRMDRITNYTLKKEHFKVEYKDRFEEGEFRKRIQFMHSGPLLHITFRFCGPSLSAILDRLPTARIVSQDERGKIIEAEVFGNGVRMWLLSQGPYIEVIKPQDFRQQIKETLEKTLSNYADDM